MTGARLMVGLLGVICGGVLILAGSAGAENLVANGSFEANGLSSWVQYDPTGTYVYPGYWGGANGESLDPNTGGNPWTGVGYRPDQGGFTFYPREGNANYAFGAWEASMMTGGTVLYQDLATTPGQQYVLTFYIQHSNLGSNVGPDVWFKAKFAGVQQVSLVGGQNFLKGVNGTNIDGSGFDTDGNYWSGAVLSNYTDANGHLWAEFRPMGELTFTVTATGSTSRLEFQGYNNNNDYWHIDDISVSAVPEPFTAALLGAGGLALLRRKRK